MTSEKYVTEVKPRQLVRYNSLMIAFFDKFHEQKGIWQLFIHIRNDEDRYTIVEREAVSIKRPDHLGNIYHEKMVDSYKRAYDKYLETKAAKSVDYRNVNDSQAKMIADLQEKARLAELKAEEAEFKALQAEEKLTKTSNGDEKRGFFGKKSVAHLEEEAK